MSFRDQLFILINEHVQRSAKVKKKHPNELFELLNQGNLSVKEIDSACCKELIRIVSLRYESIQLNSNRLDGYGWSSSKIHEHMLRFIKHKIALVIETLHQERIVLENHGLEFQDVQKDIQERFE
jgi:hypothetical protein